MGNLHYTLKMLDKKDDEYDGFDYDEDFFTFDRVEKEQYSESIIYSCKHKWVWYNSLFPNGSFQYCEYCDEKKNK